MNLLKNGRHSWLLVMIFFVFVVSIAAAAAMNTTEKPSYMSQDPVHEVLLTLNSNGFDPAELRPPSGRFLLSVDDRSGAGELTLRLLRTDGKQIRELKIPAGGGDWSEVFDLSAGTYTLSEANHSTWVCTIIVQKKNGQP